MLTKSALNLIILEELSKTDKDVIKKLISTELKKELKKALKDEIEKAFSAKETREQIGEITKKVLKRLYKDISLHHPYIIDRIKV
jgi:tRNA A37 threonylcarbamoyladenosine dehydratase